MELSKAATQHPINVASAPSDQLAIRCPTCSADFELRDRTYQTRLLACPFCDTERPKQMDASSAKMHLDWVPPVRVPASTLLSTNGTAERRSQLLSPSRNVYMQRSYPVVDVSAYSLLEDPWKPKESARVPPAAVPTSIVLSTDETLERRSQSPQSSQSSYRQRSYSPVALSPRNLPTGNKISKRHSRSPSPSQDSTRQRSYSPPNVGEIDILEKSWPPEENWKRWMATRNKAKTPRRGFRKPKKIIIQAEDAEKYVQSLLNAGN